MAQGEDFRLQGGSRPDRCTEGVRSATTTETSTGSLFVHRRNINRSQRGTDFSVGQGRQLERDQISSSIRMLPPDAVRLFVRRSEQFQRNVSRETSTTCAWHCCHCPVLDAGLDRRLFAYATITRGRRSLSHTSR